jgi:hypothetical protein
MWELWDLGRFDILQRRRQVAYGGGAPEMVEVLLRQVVDEVVMPIVVLAVEEVVVEEMVMHTVVLTMEELVVEEMVMPRVLLRLMVVTAVIPPIWFILMLDLPSFPSSLISFWLLDQA